MHIFVVVVVNTYKMKKLLFILIPVSIFSQERVIASSGKTVILNKDYTWKYDDKTGLSPEDFKITKDNISAGLLNKVKIPIKNGEDEVVNVEFTYLSKIDDFNRISYKKTQKMIDDSREILLLSLKNRYSFIPRKININYSESNKKWVVSWNYTAKNSYGGEVEGDKMIFFDNDLNHVNL